MKLKHQDSSSQEPLKLGGFDVDVFHLAIDRSKDVVLITDVENKIVYINQTFTDFYGYGFEEVRGKNPKLLQSGEQSGEFYQKMWNGLEETGQTVVQLINRTKSGDLVKVESSVSKIVSDSGEFVGYLAIQRDLTGRSQIEKELKLSQERLSSVLSAVKEGITLSDESGKFLVFNAEMVNLAGYSQEEAQAAGSFYQLLHPEAKTEIPPGLEKLVPGQKYNTQETIVTKDGQTKHLSVSTVVLEQNNQVMYLSAYHDVTQIKGAHLSLEKEKQKVELEVKERTKSLMQAKQDLQFTLDQASAEANKSRTILESIGDAVVVVDMAGNIVLANGAANNMSGSEASIVSMSFGAGVKLVDALLEKPVEFVEQILGQKQTGIVSLRCVLTKEGGDQIEVAVTAAPLNDGDGKLSGAVVVYRDVSRESQIEKMKDEFVSLASHQLRTPLTALRWIADRLAKNKPGNLDADQLEMTQDIRESTLRLIGLVNDLLSISRIESGRIQLALETTNMTEMIDSVLGELSSKLEEKSQTVVKEYDPVDLSFDFDPQLVRQVVMNLLSNAAKYSPEKTQITVKTSKDEKMFHLGVIDQGGGIPESDHHRIFGRFFRSESAVKSGSEGTGLGLYLTKQIIQASGGVINFDSKVGEGTTFCFSLPLSPVVKEVEKEE